ncbi:glycosyltransferase [bacterium]|nr:MAG: glycosyltransferase [bacterium]
MTNRILHKGRDNSFLDVLGMRIDLVQIPGVIEIVSGWIKNKEHGNYIVVSNAYDAVVSRRDSRVKNAVNSSSLTVLDGISLVLLARLKGYGFKKRVYGPDLMLNFLKVAQEKGYSSFFYGTTEATLGLLLRYLKSEFPDLKISGCYAPPFGKMAKEEDEKVARLINEAKPDVVWVGLGCPKQQLWMYGHKDALRVPVMIGVGAAFDFLAGVKPQAPLWIRDNGFEWLFRLVTEPKRLWRRYLLDYPLFVYYIVMDLIFAPHPRRRTHSPGR